MTWSSAGGGEYLGLKLPGVTAPLLPPEGGAAFGAGVSVTGHALLVPDPRAWFKTAPPPAKHGNLHPVDLQFWFYNIQQNVPQRIEAWKRAAGK